MTFNQHINAAARRVEDANMPSNPGVGLDVIVAKMDEGLRNANTDALFDAYVMLRVAHAARNS